MKIKVLISEEVIHAYFLDADSLEEAEEKAMTIHENDELNGKAIVSVDRCEIIDSIEVDELGYTK